MRPFPRRTILLMVIALLVFARLYWVTHHAESADPAQVVHFITLDAGVAP